ncbi:hypothetical protein DL98DRAFT_121944 [Cadophora sp. DSE1049]|nr:hypothetical protein DL98DRAFT_121944 [Cadophora sp. DSE1049]
MIDPNLFLSPTYVHTLQSWSTTRQAVIPSLPLPQLPNQSTQASTISKPSFTLDAISSIHPLIHPIHPGNASKEDSRTKPKLPHRHQVNGQRKEVCSRPSLILETREEKRRCSIRVRSHSTPASLGNQTTHISKCCSEKLPQIPCFAMLL